MLSEPNYLYCVKQCFEMLQELFMANDFDGLVNHFPMYEHAIITLFDQVKSGLAINLVQEINLLLMQQDKFISLLGEKHQLLTNELNQFQRSKYALRLYVDANEI